MSPLRAKLIWWTFLIGVAAVILSWSGAAYTVYTVLPEYNVITSLAVALILLVYLYVIYAVAIDTRYEPSQKRVAIWTMLAFGIGCGLVTAYVLSTFEFTILADGRIESYELSESTGVCNEPTEPDSDAVCH